MKAASARRRTRGPIVVRLLRRQESLDDADRLLADPVLSVKPGTAH